MLNLSPSYSIVYTPQAFLRIIVYSKNADGHLGVPEPHILSIHKRDGNFYIIGGERDCRVFKCEDQHRLGDLLYTQIGRATLLNAIRGNDVFDSVDFDRSAEGSMQNVLLVPKVFCRPVCRRWDNEAEDYLANANTCSLGYQVIGHDEPVPEGVPFVVSFMETNSSSIVHL